MSRETADASDEDLAARARNGDEEALGILLERHVPALRERLRRRLVGPLRRKVGESDVIQVAFLAAAQKLGDFEDRGDGSFGRWLDQIVEYKLKNVFREYLGAAKRDVGREVTHDRRPETRDLRARAPTPSAEAVADELKERVDDAREDLPEHYRHVLHLVQERGLTLAEVGQLMDRSPKAVAKLYARALRKLTGLVFGEEDREASS